MINLSKKHKYILRAMRNGATLKAHRYLDGTKIHQLHPLEGPAETLSRDIIDDLKAYHLIDSNKKFPAATYILTTQGYQVAENLED